MVATSSNLDFFTPNKNFNKNAKRFSKKDRHEK
jgi:hypothetical protein